MRWSGFRSKAAGVLVCGLVLGGCAAIPQQGAVEVGDVAVNEPGPVFLQPDGPAVNASPEEIVRGFLAAQAVGVNEDWATARTYLTPAAGQAWDPTIRTTVYPSEPDLDQVGGPEPDPTTDPLESGAPATTPAPEDLHAEVVGTVPVAATLDPDGRFTEAAAGTTQDLTFSLELDAAGQWRIAATEDGMFISRSSFVATYVATTLYFPTSSGAFLVPDVRWYSRLRTPAYAVNGLLAGPSPWLRDAVEPSVPSGTTLISSSVPVDNGTAVVNLSQQVLDTSTADRAMLQAQLDAVLLHLDDIRSVTILVNGTPLQVDATVTPQRDPVPVLDMPLVLAGGVVSQVDAQSTTPYGDYLSVLDRNPTALAVDATATQLVFRSGTTMIATVPTPTQELRVLVEGTDLLAPSIDPLGWVWTGSAQPSTDPELPRLRAARPSGEVATVTADWLIGRRIDSIRLSRDGARIAVVSSAAGSSRIDVAAVLRGKDDTPVRLGESFVVGASVLDAGPVVWVDESTLAVLARGQASAIPTVHFVPLADFAQPLSGVDGSNWIAAGWGKSAVFVGTVDHELYRRASTGATWSELIGGVSFPTFPG